MRDIKFRVWDGEKMIPAGVIPNVRHLVTTKEFDFGSMEAVVQLHETETDTLMQYTGIKDKNGVEIYEGDIVSNSSETFPIEWQDDAACNSCWSVHGGYSFGANNIESFEVIGNIYENPDIIEATA